MEEMKYTQIFTEIKKISSTKELIIAIEGGSASGKTTLSKKISELFDCNVFHVDDYFLRPFQRTSQRLNEVGGNVDRERLFEEIITPITKNEDVSYRRYDCSTHTLGETTTLPHKRITVVEGVYSMHPEFSHYFDLAVFLDIEPELQRKRILIRNAPELAHRFFNEWIPMEEKYFKKFDVKNRSNIIIKSEDLSVR